MGKPATSRFQADSLLVEGPKLTSGCQHRYGAFQSARRATGTELTSAVVSGRVGDGVHSGAHHTPELEHSNEVSIPIEALHPTVLPVCHAQFSFRLDDTVRDVEKRRAKRRLPCTCSNISNYKLVRSLHIR